MNCVGGIWQDVLGIPSVSINDNFFALGGDSIKATQVISRIRQRLHVDVSIQSLFVAPTVAALAQELSAGGSERHPASSDANGNSSAYRVRHARRNAARRRNQRTVGKTGGGAIQGDGIQSVLLR